MKNIKIFILLSVSILSILGVWNCKREDNIKESSNGFPEQIVVDIPDAISATTSLKSAVAADSLPLCPDLQAFPADSIYWQVRTFIGIGEFSADFIQQLVSALKKFNISKPMEFEYTSNDDGKQKKVVVTDNASFNGVIYDLKLHMTDKTSGKTAMEMYWFKNKEEGVILACPYYINTADQGLQKQTMLRYKVIFYGTKTADYDRKMLVYISDYQPEISDVFGMTNLEMEVTKKDDLVSVGGISVHPKAFFADTSKKGIAYCFVANASVSKNIGVIKLSLPPVNDDSVDVFTNYAVKNVIKKEMNYYLQTNFHVTADDPYVKDCVNLFLSNMESPAYYKATGYVGCGANVPGTEFSQDLLALPLVAPVSPKQVNNLNLAAEMTE